MSAPEQHAAPAKARLAAAVRSASGASKMSVGNNPPQADEAEILKTLNVLHEPGSVIELRALYKGIKRTDAGYFDGDSRPGLAKEAVRLSNEGTAVYISMNEIDPQLLARYANRVQRYADATVTDANVTRRKWLLVDIDPQRPKNTSATHEKLSLADSCRESVRQFLDGLGWPDPVEAESGNGFHLLYRIDLPNDTVSADLIKRCLEALSEKFDDDKVKIDRSVFNAGRIVKLHGTVSNKGDSIPAAPWRLSRLVSWPDVPSVVSIEQLVELAGHVKPAAPRPTVPTQNKGLPAWDVGKMEAFLTRGNLQATGPEPHDGALRWKLKTCPFNADHGPGESAVFLCSDGRLGFDCRHNSCQDKQWQDLRTLVDGDRAARSLDARPGGSGAKSVASSHTEAWPSPTPLPDGLPEVPPFELELLPPVLRARVEDISERMQCPPDFAAVASIVTLASVIGTRVKIAPKRHDDWTVVPNLWAVIIGRPGVMKTPALQEVMKPLQSLQASAHERYEAEQREYEAGKLFAEQAKRVAKDAIHKALKAGNSSKAEEAARAAVTQEDPEPVCRRYIVNDCTVEKLGELLNQNPGGLMVYRDELAGFFRTLERSGHEGDRAFYLEAWNGAVPFTYDRIGRGTLHISNTCVSMLGSIQPGPIAELLRGMRGSGDDGLLQRFQLAVWPNQTPEWRNVDRRPNLAARQAAEDLVAKIDRLPLSESVTLRFDSAAQEMFDNWRGHLETRLRGSEHPMLEAHLAKYRSLVPSLALILHLVESLDGPVSLLALERAIAWAEYLEPHARRIYAPAMSPDVDAARLLAQKINARELPERFTLRDIYRNHWSGLDTREQAAAAVSVLEDYDWLRPEQGNSVGRPKVVYTVNPLVPRGNS